MDVMELRRGLLMSMASNDNAMWKLFQTYATRLNNIFYGAVLPETVEIDLNGFESLYSLRGIFTNTTGANTIRIKNFKSNLTNIDITNLFYRALAATCIEFVNCDFAPQNCTEAFLSANKLVTINGELDFTNATNVNSIFSDTPKLVDVRFKANSLNVSMSGINASPLLSDASLVSIANGLNASVTGQSIRFHATPKARCSAIMGENVGGMFIQNDQGTMTLESFITTIKGWSLA